jgi:hypothetical protein
VVIVLDIEYKVRGKNTAEDDAFLTAAKKKSVARLPSEEK